jgi:D-arabinose 1-dehydrogenase-like Zn-dependent alcohol dehydrogenase
MKAAVIEATNQVRVKVVPKPECSAGKVLIKIAYGGFCGPTEMCIIEGLHPRAKFPLVFCHEFAGTVEAVAPGSAFKPGDRVVVNPLRFCGKCETCRAGYSYVCGSLNLIGIDCDGGFAEYCAVPEENVLRIPDSLPFKIAAIVEPVAVGVHAVRGAGVGVGDSVLVFGAGPHRHHSRGSEPDGRRGQRHHLRSGYPARFVRALAWLYSGNGRVRAEKIRRRLRLRTGQHGRGGVLPYAVELVKIRGRSR